MGMKRRPKLKVPDSFKKDITGEWVCIDRSANESDEVVAQHLEHANGSQPRTWWYAQDKISKQQ
jgi:hypothetical protein